MATNGKAYDLLAGASPLDPTKRTGVLIAGMGGPDGPEAVVPFLRNLFADPAVLPLPAPFARLLGSLIVRRRAEEVRERYLSLGYGGASPQLDWTRRQAKALAERLGERGLTLRVEPAMRYWRPFIDETIDALRDWGAEQLLVIPADPQFSGATTGSSLDAIADCAARLAPELPLRWLTDWHLLPGYLDALAREPAAALTAWAEAGVSAGECGLLFAAHSLPERFIRRGDPYLDQTMASVRGAHERVRRSLGERGAWLDRVAGGMTPRVGFQSKVGPVRWIGPSLEAETERLATAGCRRLFVQPVSFSSEHIETLHELDRDLAALARAGGIVEFQRGPALNLDPGWIDGLAGHIHASGFALAGGPPASRPGEVAHA